MRLKIDSFAGIAPKQKLNASGRAFAEIAENTDLERGTINSFYKPLKVHHETGKALFIDDCCVWHSDDCRDNIFKYGLFCDGLYIRQTNGELFYAKNCQDQWKKLGFDCDLSAPMVQTDFIPPTDLKADSNFNMEFRAYFYTLVNELGLESAPSFPSDFIETSIQSRIELTLPITADKKRIYRAQSPLDFGENQDKLVQPVWVFIGEIDGNQTQFIDDVLIGGESNQTEGFHAPPAGLFEVQTSPDGRIMALAPNQFVMSERALPHAFHPKYRVRFHDTPKALVLGENKAYVLTDGKPVVLAIQGDCQDDQLPVTVHDTDHKMPIISRRSACAFQDGVVFASDLGLVYLNGTEMKLLTEPYFTAEQWQGLLPHTMRSVIHNGYYYGATDNQTFRFRLPNQVYNGAPDNAQLITLTIRPDGWAVDEQNRLYFTDSTGTHQWNAGTEKLPYRWRSGEIVPAGKTRFSAYRLVHSGNTEIQTYLDGRLIQRLNSANVKPIRLPAGFSGNSWQVELNGTAEISTYFLSTSIKDLIHD